MERALDQFNFGRIVRWALPGWVVILAFVGFVGLDILGAGSSDPKLPKPPCPTLPEPSGSLNCSVERLLKTLENEKAVTPTVVALLTVAAAGVPLGFLIYQVYFFLKWNSPFSRLGLWPPFIMGGIDDIKLIQRDIPDERLKPPDRPNSKWREDWINHPMFETDHGFRWRYIESLFMETTKAIDRTTPDVSLYSRYRYLYELMHLLGVGLVGVYVGFLAYLAYKTRVEDRWHLGHLIFVIAIIGVLFYWMSREEDQKRNHQKSENAAGTYYSVMISQRIAIEYPASLWIVCLGIVLFMAHPVLALRHSTGLLSWDWLLRAILASVSAIFVWRTTTYQKDAASSKGSFRYVGVIVIMIFLLLGIAVFFLRDQPFFQFDWPFSLPTYVFVVINLIFVKNRQNIRDDWHGLQYYALSQFLFEPQSSSNGL